MLRKYRHIRSGLFVIAVLAIFDTLFIWSRSGGKDLGILLPAMGGISIILGLLFTKTGYYKRNAAIFNKFGLVILCLFGLWLVSFIVVTAVIFTSAITDRDQKVDCVFVLGAGLKGDKPTLVLLERLNYTLDYYEDNPEIKIIVSGGQGPGETVTEAEGMKRYLVENGIPENIVLKEEAATSTYENMVYSKKLYERTFGKRLQKVMLITNDFHMFRSKLLAKRVGLTPYGISSVTPWYIYPNVCLREYFAMFKSLLIDR